MDTRQESNGGRDTAFGEERFCAESAETAAAAEGGSTANGGSGTGGGNTGNAGNTGNTGNAAETGTGAEAKAGGAGKAAGGGGRPDGGNSDGEIIDGEILDGEILDGPEDGGREGAGAQAEEIGRLKDQLLRLTADFDNYRKRMARDKQDWSRYASQSMVEKLIPVLDNLDAAAAAVTGAGQEAKSVAEGFLMIQKQLTDMLTREGLTEIAAMGEAFDPNVHEAVMTVSRGEDREDNQVVGVLRKGYMFKDKILRPAMVQVAKD